MAEIVETPVPQANPEPKPQAPVTEVVKPGAEAPKPAAPPATEAVKEAEAAKKADDPDFSKKFAALSRQEKELFAKRQALRADLEQVDKYKKNQDLKKTDLLAYLEAEGLDVDSIVKAVIAKSGPGEETVEEKLARLEKRLKDKEDEENRKAEENKKSQETQKNQEAIDAYMNKVKTHIEANADKYETIITQNAFDQVLAVQQEFFDKYQTILPLEKAVDAVEDHLFEEAKRLSGLKKLKPQATAAETKIEAGTPATKTAPQKTTSPTLSSHMTAVQDNPEHKYLSDEESKARAAKMLRWT